jgi:hypothetical protein
MLRFKEYLELEEGIFGDILTSVKRGISKFVAVMKNALSKLGFGSEKKFSISSLVGTHISEKILDGGNYDLTSRIGYYHEHCVAYDMARILRETGFNVLNQPPSLLNKRQSEKDKISKNRLRFRLAQRKNIDKELKRAEVGAELVAQKIIDDVKKIDDVILMEFEIIHTGTTAANGVAKEDVELVVRKKDTQEVIDDVKASLKAYKKPSINLSNKTFPSYINGILFPKIDLQGKVFLAKFMASNPQYESLVNRMTFYSDGWKKNKKEKGRPYANKVINNQRGFQIIRNGLLLTIFDEAYKKDKKGINERIIQSLGLDGADDVYMAIGTDVNNMKIVSSRSSQAFQKLYQSLKNEFIVRFVIPEDENVVSAKMELIDNDTQEVLLKTTFAFKEGDIFVQFLDMKQLLDDDDAKI